MNRSRRALLVGIAVAISTTVARAEDPDPWFGKDKALHFGVSVALASGGYGVSSLFLDPMWQRAVAGASFSLTLGAGKELYDLTGHGDPSLRDFTWDVVGTAVGVGLALALDAALSPSEKEPRRPAARGMAITF